MPTSARAKRDNSTLRRKVGLRLALLRELADEPVVMETHGGYGAIWRRCYSQVERGIVFESDEARAQALAVQRPTWAVYEAKCETALEAGVGAHLPVNFLDLDPYGDPWPALRAFFLSDRPRPDTMAVAVNDGLRQALRRNIGWNARSVATAVRKYGNTALHGVYLEACREQLEELAGAARYRLDGWTGYYCG
ncbi:MAG: hypothetical protein WEE64_07165, partial [Dehalococcoidia bacterium]